jgi:hypothetical protein
MYVQQSILFVLQFVLFVLLIEALTNFLLYIDYVVALLMFMLTIV